MKKGFSLAVTEHASASHGFGVSATRYCCAEDVLVVAIVVAPFKLSNVQRQIFAADFMIAAHNTALQERPETIDSLRMHDAIDILSGTVTNSSSTSTIPMSFWKFGSARPDTMAHIVSRRIGAKAHCTLDLQSRDALFARQHHMDDAEPSAQSYIRVFEDRTNKHGKSITAGRDTFAHRPRLSGAF
jgi:hypothetical protein